MSIGSSNPFCLLANVSLRYRIELSSTEANPSEIVCVTGTIRATSQLNMARSSVAELPTGAADGLHVRRPVKYKLNRRRLVGRASQRREKMIAFGYYGGKFSHLDFILPLLPTSYQHYCEPFGGSAAVLINRKPAPVETYNDVDSEVANFFACLRDEGEELIRLISLTPFSREELVRAHKPDRGLTPLERARRFFVRARQTRTGLAQTSSEGRWAHCVLTSRPGWLALYPDGWAASKDLPKSCSGCSGCKSKTCRRLK